MKYTVDIDSVINDLIKNNVGICPALGCRKWHKCFHINAFDHPIYEMYYRDLILHSDDISHLIGQDVLKQLINNPGLFQSPLFHLLFKTFVAAEGKFIKNYIPQNSHEERLTGHLVSEIENGLFILHEYFEQKSDELYGVNVPLNFYYADLSANKQESLTGADLGLIFYVNLPDGQKHIRIAAIQAKKVYKTSARIDSNQLNTIIDEYGDNAYYMFYDMTYGKLSPMIQRAEFVKREMDNDTSNSYQRNLITNRGVPLSIFLIFDLLNSALDSKETFSSLWEAKKSLIHPGGGKNNWRRNKDKPDFDNSPTRILAITIGNIEKEEYSNIRDFFKNDYPEIEE